MEWKIETVESMIAPMNIDEALWWAEGLRVSFDWDSGFWGPN